MRVCGHCKQAFPCTPEFFHRRHGEELHRTCKTCATESVKRCQWQRTKRGQLVMALFERAQQIVARERRPEAALEAITSQWDLVA